MARLSTELRRAPTRYRPVSRIAAGGMAEVWLADAVCEAGDSYRVAIKRVLPELASEGLYRSMFEDEARLGMQLRHRNVVRVYDARDVQGTFLMIMELVDGTSLKSLLDQAHRRQACMPVPAALHLVRELARGLAYAHEATDENEQPLGIVHRDVSPHNVLLSKAGEVKLTDFGLANANVHRTMRNQDMVGGKLGYLAPEVIAQKPADRRIDLFAAGVVLWEALAGRRLFQGDSDAETVRNVMTKDIAPASTYNHHVPPRVEEVLRRLLVRDADQRISSALELTRMLDACIDATDPEVGIRDVALLVGLHIAGQQEAPVVAGLELLAQELDAFVHESKEQETGLGAEPLDPDAFDRGRRGASTPGF